MAVVTSNPSPLASGSHGMDEVRGSSPLASTSGNSGRFKGFSMGADCSAPARLLPSYCPRAVEKGSRTMAALPSNLPAFLPSAPARVGVHGLPSLRLHKGSGQYCYCFKKQWVYLGRDAARAYALWLARFGGSTEPSPSPAALAPKPARAPRLRLASAAPAAPATVPLWLPATESEPAAKLAVPVAPLAPAAPAGPARTWAEAARKMLAMIAPTVTPARAKCYGFDLAGFLKMFGGKLVTELTPEDLISYRSGLAGSFKPWTVNSRLAIVRRLLTFTADTLRWVDRSALPSHALKSVALGEVKAKAWTPAEVAAIVAKVGAKNETLGRMLRLQFLTASRPFSIPELVWERGEWESGEPGVFILKQSKTEKQTGEKVRLCLSAEALEELKAIRKAGNAPKSGPMYRQAVQRAGGPAPHALRHSAATALAKLGVADETIETALGHSMSRVKRTYRPANYQGAREALAKLAALVPAVG